MKKSPFFAAIVATCFLATASYAQEIVTQTQSANKHRYSVEGIPSQPTPMTPADSARAAWRYFWMFSDGFFTNSDTFSYIQHTLGWHSVQLSAKPIYTDDEEPNFAPKSIYVGSTPTPYASNPSILYATQEDSLHPGLGSARRGDTIYLALVVKNRSGTARSGYLKLRFPRNVFEWQKQVFAPNPAEFENLSDSEVDDNLLLPPGKIYQWEINNLPANAERTVFVEMLVKPTTPNDTEHQMQLDLHWDGDASPGNSENFLADNSTTIRVNHAIDPNEIQVSPAELPSGANALPATLHYRIDIENLGTAVANHLEVAVVLDARLDKTTLKITENDLHFPDLHDKAGTVNKNIRYEHTFSKGDTLIFKFHKANLLPVKNQDITQNQTHLTKGFFTFTMMTQPNLDLQVGDAIVTKAIVRMLNPHYIVEDEVSTNDAVVRLIEPDQPKTSKE